MQRTCFLLLFSLALAGCTAADDDGHPLPAPPPTASSSSPPTACRDSEAFGAIDSGDVCTEHLTLDMSAQCFGAGTDVYVALHAPWSTSFLELTGGDSLQAGVGSSTAQATLEPPDGTLHYTAHFDTDDPGDVYLFLNRTSARLPGAVSHVAVAPPFAITNAPASFTFGDAVSFGVDPPPASGAVSVYADGACVTSFGVGAETTVPVTNGTAVVATKNLFLGGGDCDVTFHVRVETNGSAARELDPHSTIAGLQERGFVSAMKL